MKILFATPEAVPYHKTGGLADVAESLPAALCERGHKVVLIHPLYRSVRKLGLPLRAGRAVRIPWPGGGMNVRFHEYAGEGGPPAIFVEQPHFFEVDRPYEPTPRDPMAAGRRFALFCRAVTERARTLDADIVHLNDWQTGLVPLYGLLDGLPAATVFTIHNLAYQGNFSPALLPEIGVPASFHRTENGLEFYGQSSFLKGALALADRLVTVSPTYALEIQTPEFGAGMDGLLRFRRRVLHGILNGIDPTRWDPAHDPAVPRQYDARRLEEKDANREELLHELGLEGSGPLLVMITRLAEQKGIELVLAALDAILELGASLAILGDGPPHYEEAIADAVRRHPRRVAALFRFDDALARRLYAGGDFFLMPSIYEPCGLGQMIAQRFGTPPIVRRTGGLADTVEDGATGFSFGPADPRALVDAVARACRAWRARGWDVLRRRCMSLDWSWTRSAAAYEDVYRMAIGTVPRVDSGGVFR